MKKPVVRVHVLGMLTSEPVLLSVLYRQSPYSRQALLAALRRAAEDGLCVLLEQPVKTIARGGRPTQSRAFITPAGLAWLEAPEAADPQAADTRKEKTARGKVEETLPPPRHFDAFSNFLRRPW